MIVGTDGLAGRDGASACRVLLDDEVGPLLVGLRTLEWRWDRLPAIGVDPDEMLADLVHHAAAAVKLAGDLAPGALLELALELYGVVVALADGIVPGPHRSLELARSVTLATDLHAAVETCWRQALVSDPSVLSGD